MAKKATPAKSTAVTTTSKAPAAATIAKQPAAPVASTPVRSTPIPKIASAAPAARKATPEITQDMIAQRAYEIFLSGSGGSQEDNWFRAEQELRGV